MIRRLSSHDFLGLNAGAGVGVITGNPLALVVWGGSPAPLGLPFPMQVQNFGSTQFNRGLLRVQPFPTTNSQAGFVIAITESPILDTADVFAAPMKTYPIYIRVPGVCYDIDILPSSHGALVWAFNLDPAFNNTIFNMSMEFFGVT